MLAVAGGQLFCNRATQDKPRELSACLVSIMMVLSLRRVPVPGMETHIPVLFLDLSGTLFSLSFVVPIWQNPLFF